MFLINKCGFRAYGPLCSIINEDIAMGPLPFSNEVQTLQSPPYNIGAIVNMCAEAKGPMDTYELHSIKYLHCPVFDTTKLRLLIFIVFFLCLFSHGLRFSEKQKANNAQIRNKKTKKTNEKKKCM